MVWRRSSAGLTKDFIFSGRGALRRRADASKWNVEGGLHRVVLGWLSFVALFFSLLALTDGWVDGSGRCPRAIVGMRVSLFPHHVCQALYVTQFTDEYFKNCGICYERASPGCCCPAEQPEPDGPPGLRTRGWWNRIPSWRTQY